MINAFILQHKPFTPQIVENPEAIRYVVIDLFCGAGGTTTGFAQAKDNSGNPIAIIAACVNHDHKAIRSHWENHPEVYHFEEDIRTLELSPLTVIVDKYRELYPWAKIVLWASLECTNFSKAKGGQSRDADSRTLADHLDRYIKAIDPDYVQIENVVEFMSWGPMTSRVKKTDEGYLCCEFKWVEVDQYKEIWKEVSAGLREDGYKLSGEVTSSDYITYRTEVQLIPESSKNGKDWLRWKKHINSFGYRDEWRELNSADFGAYTSRNRLFGCFAKDNLPIVWPEPTHSKNGTGKQDLFGNGLLKWKPVKDLLDFKDEGESILGRKKPLVENSLKRIYAGLIKEVAGGKDAFLTKYYGNEKGAHSVNTACGTLTTDDRFALHQVYWLDKQYSGQHNHQSINQPAGSILRNDKHALMTTGFIYNPSHGGHTTSIETGCPTIIARQDKSPLYFIQYSIDQNVRIEIYEDDSETMIKIKEFMALYGISDIKMRMLKVSELKLIQGFPADYKLYGNQSDQKKFIGNSVVPDVVKAWAEAQGKELLKLAA